MYRLVFIGSVLLWVSAMSALFVRDVWPAWTAQDAPPVTRELLTQVGERKEQYGIFGSNGVRLGTAWGEVGTGAAGGTSVIASAALALSPLPESYIKLPEIYIKTQTDFTPEGGLDTFDLNVYGVRGTRIRAHGE